MDIRLPASVNAPNRFTATFHPRFHPHQTGKQRSAGVDGSFWCPITARQPINHYRYAAALTFTDAPAEVALPLMRNATRFPGATKGVFWYYRVTIQPAQWLHYEIHLF